MAKNIRQGGGNEPVNRVGLAVTDPASPLSGDVCRWGGLVGIAEITMDANTLITTINLDCIAEVPVKGIDAGGNVAVAAGEKLYYTDADTPKLSKKATGTFAGYAFGNALTDGGPDIRSGQLVASAGTATIRVLFGH